MHPRSGCQFLLLRCLCFPSPGLLDGTRLVCAQKPTQFSAGFGQEPWYSFNIKKINNNLVFSKRLSIRHYQKGADAGAKAVLPSWSCPFPPRASLYPLPGAAGSKAPLPKQLLHPDGEPGEKSAGKVRLDTGTWLLSVLSWPRCSSLSCRITSVCPQKPCPLQLFFSEL